MCITRTLGAREFCARNALLWTLLIGYSIGTLRGGKRYVPIPATVNFGTLDRKMVVRFPKKQAMLRRLGLVRATKQVALDTEIRQVDQAIAALKERRRILLSEYKKEVSITAKATSGYMVACCLLTAYGWPLASLKNALMIVSTIAR